MLFQQAQHRAKAAQDHAKAAQDQAKVANKVALQAEKDNDAAQKELQELQRVMEPKRARTHAATADDDEECEKQSCDDWDLPDHHREATRIQNTAQFLSALTEKFQLRRKARPARWSIFFWGLWDGLCCLVKV